MIISPARHFVMPQSKIDRALNAIRARYDYVFTTGGIGPTHDDITVDAIAAALGVPVVMHPEAEAALRDYYGDRITDARLRMAREDGLQGGDVQMVVVAVRDEQQVHRRQIGRGDRRVDQAL